MGCCRNLPKTGKLGFWDPGGTLTANGQLRTELRPPICRLHGMTGRPMVGLHRIWMGICRKNGRPGVPKIVGPREGSELKTDRLPEEISAGRCQIRPQNLKKTSFRTNNDTFPLFGGPPWGPSSWLMLQYAFRATGDRFGTI